MNILFAASELSPYASTGPLGEATGALARELQARGHEISVVLPFYRDVREASAGKISRTGAKFSVQVGPGILSCEIRETRSPDGYQVFFVERDEFFDRSGLYGMDGRDYQDNSARFTFFAKCALELARRMDPAPDIIHAHDWQAALVPVFAAHQKLGIRTVLSAHSLETQGNFWSFDFGLTNLPGEYFSPRGLEYYGSLNFLKGGMLAANAIVLPGPRFAAAAQTAEHGCGLDPVLREQAGKIEGIAPGLDSEAWNPASDSLIHKPYEDPSGKAANRKALLDLAGISHSRAGKPCILVATQSGDNDGMDILVPALDRIVEAGSNVIILGEVAPENLSGLLIAARQHAGWITWFREYDEKTLHQALAGADLLLIPAPVEPRADLVQKALGYGVIPLSLICRGLGLLVPPYRGPESGGLGFTFHLPEPAAIVDGLRYATSVFNDQPTWQALVSRAMQVDFSWAAAAEHHANLYSVLTHRKERRAA